AALVHSPQIDPDGATCWQVLRGGDQHRSAATAHVQQLLIAAQAEPVQLPLPYAELPPKCRVQIDAGNAQKCCADQTEPGRSPPDAAYRGSEASGTENGGQWCRVDAVAWPAFLGHAAKVISTSTARQGACGAGEARRWRRGAAARCSPAGAQPRGSCDVRRLLVPRPCGRVRRWPR